MPAAGVPLTGIRSGGWFGPFFLMVLIAVTSNATRIPYPSEFTIAMFHHSLLSHGSKKVGAHKT